MRTTATRDGDHWVLNGEKSLVPLAAEAELFLVAAATEDGPAVFIVEGGSDGLTAGDDPSMGIRASAQRPLYLKDVRVPADQRLGSDDFDYQAFVDLGTLGWCALAVGTAQAVLDYVIPYVNERQAFGEPISHRQAVAFMVADIAIELESMRMLTYRAACRAEQGGASSARPTWPAPWSRKRPCKSAPTASSCWAATASPTNTRWNAGTGICAPSAWPSADCICKGTAHEHRNSQKIQTGDPQRPPSGAEQLPADLAQVRPRRARAPQGTGHGGLGAGRLQRRRPGQLRRRQPDRQGQGEGRRLGEERRQHDDLPGALEFCYGDTGFLLGMPRQGLGNAAIAAVATDEQLERFQGKWAAMAITEPGAGSDSAAIRTTAREDGDHYVLNGEKIYVTSGERADCVVVWATLDPKLGRAAIKSFVVEWGTPGMELARLEKKLGIRASDTAAISFNDCRVPRENLLGNPEVDTKGFGGVMETFDNTRPLVACFALGVAKASLERTRELLAEAIDYDYGKPVDTVGAAEADLYRMEAEWEAAYWLAMKAAWMADNKQSNSVEASISKAKAGRVGNQITLRCVELAGSVGYTEDELLEKWARDSKILDIFEGTQQIQKLIIARRVLGLSSKELK